MTFPELRESNPTALCRCGHQAGRLLYRGDHMGIECLCQRQLSPKIVKSGMSIEVPHRTLDPQSTLSALTTLLPQSTLSPANELLPKH